MRSCTARGYGTQVTLTDRATIAADAQQAAYFRAELTTERNQLMEGIAKRRAIIERRAYASSVRADATRAEAEVRYLDRLIASIDRRFPSVSENTG